VSGFSQSACLDHRRAPEHELAFTLSGVVVALAPDRLEAAGAEFASLGALCSDAV
jgi:hypothetical protein